MMSNLALSLLSFVFCLTAHAEISATRELIASTQTGEKIEFYWSKPEGTGPFPVLLLIHPEQSSPKNGGESFVKFGQLDYWAKKGFVTLAISQPGYGGSEGSADFCGPKTQQAVLDLVHHMQTMKEVDPKQLFIYGGSRGAVVASMVATKENSLKGVILKSGVYDFVEWAKIRPWYDSIKLTMLWEAGWLTEEKLKERSAYYWAEKIKVPLLLLHGTSDSRAPLSIVEKFTAKVNELGGKAHLVKIESEHVIPMPKINGLMEEFMRGLK
jgi:dipeptidyl aminopeptidase/acylaminoacyl peptidase